MQHRVGGPARKPQVKVGRPARYTRVPVDDSGSGAMLHGCPVVTANGEMIGRVQHLVVDVRTQQVRYVILGCGRRKAEVAIPWKALYFDSALARLVFYTWP